MNAYKPTPIYEIEGDFGSRFSQNFSFQGASSTGIKNPWPSVVIVALILFFIFRK